MKIRELPPIKESTEDYEQMEARIKRAFLEILYRPLVRDFAISEHRVVNEKSDPLGVGIAKGEVTYRNGRFTGKFNSKISAALRKLGAKWDTKSKSYVIEESKLSVPVRTQIAASDARFQEKLISIDIKLAKIMPEEIAGKIKTADLFDSSLWKIDREVKKTLKGISVPPTLTKKQTQKIADDWQNNMDLWIKDFSESEIKKLRKDIKDAAFSGNRRKAIEETIRKSYGVTENKAKFLARQETALLMAKFKETRYTDSGIKEYRWGCVAGSANHPVRPSHKILEGKIFSWSNPPITTAPDEPARRNNPGQDYNCRCFAKPIVKFRDEA